ncbi:MAG: DNA alkylation repair protein [Patescibacteria group bacterium]|nr:DNA alkylation repair protein [Patescibacteria group bacterium]
MKAEEIIKRLKSQANPKNVEGMARFGIKADKAFGVSLSTLRKMAKEIGKDHELALELWNSDWHEVKMLTGLIDDPKLVTEKQMDVWVSNFDSWDICDTICGSLFDKVPFCYKKALSYTKNKREFVKRAGFVIYAWAAVHDKKEPDETFEKFLEVIKREATDERNYVRKAVNWALREIGKVRSSDLHKKSLEIAYEIQKIDSKSARWIAGDAIRELESDYIKKRFK